MTISSSFGVSQMFGYFSSVHFISLCRSVSFNASSQILDRDIWQVYGFSDEFDDFRDMK